MVSGWEPTCSAAGDSAAEPKHVSLKRLRVASQRPRHDRKLDPKAFDTLAESTHLSCITRYCLPSIGPVPGHSPPSLWLPSWNLFVLEFDLKTHRLLLSDSLASHMEPWVQRNVRHKPEHAFELEASEPGGMCLHTHTHTIHVTPFAIFPLRSLPSFRVRCGTVLYGTLECGTGRCGTERYGYHRPPLGTLRNATQRYAAS